MEAEVRGRRKQDVQKQRVSASKFDTGKKEPKTIFPLRLTVGQRQDLDVLAEGERNKESASMGRLVLLSAAFVSASMNAWSPSLID